jgi:hypothetical protein
MDPLLEIDYILMLIELTLLGITDILCGHFLSWGPYFTLFCVVFVH